LSGFNSMERSANFGDLFYFYAVERNTKKITPEDARQKIYRYCAYQERCHQEVKSKLFEYGIDRHIADEIITDLITEGYLNEERFAKAFAGGKFRMKKWGKLKIERELEMRGLTPACIRSGLKEIDDNSYLDVLQKLIQSKWNNLSEPSEFIKKDKIAAYVIQKGFEPDLVWRILKGQL
jgi:regulatory protein